MNSKNDAKISVIVPVYNAEPYIANCIESLLRQTYTNIEILLVDDGSTDKSGDICDVYAKKDQRINVFHIVNNGVSNARNYAMDRATGDYVCFVDADDDVKDFYIQHFVDAITKDIDIYISGSNIIHLHQSVEPLVYAKSGVCDLVSIFSANELCRHGYASAKLYNLKKIRGWRVKFNINIKFSEDLLFILECLTHSKKIYYIPFADYNYYIRESSASTKIYPLQIEMSCYKKITKTIQDISVIHDINLWEFGNVGEITSMLFARIRNAMYCLPNISKNMRMDIYRSLSTAEIKRIYKYRYINNMMIRIGYFFLEKRMYKIADMYMKILYEFR